MKVQIVFYESSSLQAFDKFYSWFPSFLDMFPDEVCFLFLQKICVVVFSLLSHPVIHVKMLRKHFWISPFGLLSSPSLGPSLPPGYQCFIINKRHHHHQLPFSSTNSLPPSLLLPPPPLIAKISIVVIFFFPGSSRSSLTKSSGPCFVQGGSQKTFNGHMSLVFIWLSTVKLVQPMTSRDDKSVLLLHICVMCLINVKQGAEHHQKWPHE